MIVHVNNNFMKSLNISYDPKKMLHYINSYNVLRLFLSTLSLNSIHSKSFHMFP